MAESGNKINDILTNQDLIQKLDQNSLYDLLEHFQLIKEGEFDFTNLDKDKETLSEEERIVRDALEEIDDKISFIMELIKIRNNPNLNLNETIEELRKSNFEEMETYDLIEKQNLLIRLLAKLENEEIGDEEIKKEIEGYINELNEQIDIKNNNFDENNPKLIEAFEKNLDEYIKKIKAESNESIRNGMADKVSKYLQYLIKTGETNFKENLKKKVKFSSLIELPLMINMALEHQEELKDVNGDDKNTRKIFLKNTNKLDEIQKVIEDILSPNKTIIENLQENLMPGENINSFFLRRTDYIHFITEESMLDELIEFAKNQNKTINIKDFNQKFWNKEKYLLNDGINLQGGEYINLLNESLNFRDEKELLNKLILKEKNNEINLFQLMEKFVEIKVPAKILSELIMENGLGFISYYINDYIFNNHLKKLEQLLKENNITETQKKLLDYFLGDNGKYQIERKNETENTKILRKYNIAPDKIEYLNIDEILKLNQEKKNEIGAILYKRASSDNNHTEVICRLIKAGFSSPKFDLILNQKPEYVIARIKKEGSKEIIGKISPKYFENPEDIYGILVALTSKLSSHIEIIKLFSKVNIVNLDILLNIFSFYFKKAGDSVMARNNETHSVTYKDTGIKKLLEDLNLYGDNINRNLLNAILSGQKANKQNKNLYEQIKNYIGNLDIEKFKQYQSKINSKLEIFKTEIGNKPGNLNFENNEKNNGLKEHLKKHIDKKLPKEILEEILNMINEEKAFTLINYEQMLIKIIDCNLTDDEKNEIIKSLNEGLYSYTNKKIEDELKESEKDLKTEYKNGDGSINGEKFKEEYKKYLKTQEKRLENLSEEERKKEIEKIKEEFIEKAFINKLTGEKLQTAKKLLSDIDLLLIFQKGVENPSLIMTLIRTGKPLTFDNLEQLEKQEQEQQLNTIKNAQTQTTTQNNNIICSRYGDFDILTGTTTFDINGQTETLTLNDKEKKLVESNSEILGNIINFYKTLTELGIEKLWQHREDIFKGIQNTTNAKQVKLNAENNNYLDKEEIKTFLNSILKSVGKTEIKESDFEKFKADFRKANEMNGNRRIEKDTITGRTTIEGEFYKKFIPEGASRFDLEAFKKALKGGEQS